MNYYFSSESVSEGHPDKVADQISNKILVNYLALDPNSKVACEVLAQIELWNNNDQYSNQVHLLPKILDEKVAYLHLKKFGVELDILSSDQSDYIGVNKKGPFKKNYYRY